MGSLSNEIIKDIESRRHELIKDLINESIKPLTSEEALVTTKLFLKPPPGDGPAFGNIGKLALLSLRDALEDMGILPGGEV